jgi:hypothetical protein
MKPPPSFEDVRLAHGLLASITFVLFMPLGTIAMRTLSFKDLIWFHAGWMAFTYTMAHAALDLGVWMAYILHFDKAHAIIGLIVIGSVLLEPITGLVHHLCYKRAASRPNVAAGGHLSMVGSLGSICSLPLLTSPAQQKWRNSLRRGCWCHVLDMNGCHTHILHQIGRCEGCETGERIFTPDGEKRSVDGRTPSGTIQ